MNNLSSRLPNLLKAVLPVAILAVLGFLMKMIGTTEFEVIAKPGQAILDNLGLMLAMTLSYGLVKDNNGAAALAGAVGFFVMKNVAGVIDEKANVVLLGGIIIGLVAGLLYNKFHKITLPEFLGFFSGRRFVPIITSFAAVGIGVILGIIM